MSTRRSRVVLIAVVTLVLALGAAGRRAAGAVDAAPVSGPGPGAAAGLPAYLNDNASGFWINSNSRWSLAEGGSARRIGRGPWERADPGLLV